MAPLDICTTRHNKWLLAIIRKPGQALQPGDLPTWACYFLPRLPLEGSHAGELTSEAGSSMAQAQASTSVKALRAAGPMGDARDRLPYFPLSIRRNLKRPDSGAGV